MFLKKRYKDMKKIFIGIDFSKEKFDATMIVLLSDGTEESVHNTFGNAKEGYRALLRWVGDNSPRHGKESVLFCGEHTGIYSTGLSVWLHDKGFEVSLVNPYAVKHSMGLVRGKDDKADSAAIARYCRDRHRELHLFKPQGEELQQIKALLSMRETLVDSRNRMAVPMKETAQLWDASPAMKRMRRRVEKITEEIKDLEKDITELMDTIAQKSPELKENYGILMSFKGVSTINTMAMLVYTDNFTKFDTPRQMMCYWGVAPFHRESGSSVHSSPHVSSFANKWVKKLISEAARSAVVWNKPISGYYHRLLAEGKHPGVAMNNAKAKIINIIFAMVRKQEKFNPNFETTRRMERMQMALSC